MWNGYSLVKRMDHSDRLLASVSQDNLSAGHHLIPVLEEFVSIDRQVIETGKVRISKSVSEEIVTVNIPIVNESYKVHHVPGSPVLLDTPPLALRKDGDTTIINVIREVSVIVKKYELVEEIHITPSHYTNPTYPGDYFA